MKSLPSPDLVPSPMVHGTTFAGARELAMTGRGSASAIPPVDVVMETLPQPTEGAVEPTLWRPDHRPVENPPQSGPWRTAGGTGRGWTEC